MISDVCESEITLGVEGLCCLDIEKLHRLFARITVDVKNFSILARLHLYRNPRNICVENEDNICGFDGRFRSLYTDFGWMASWERHLPMLGVKDSQSAYQVCYPLKCGHCSMIASKVASHNQRALSMQQGVGQ